MLYRTHLSAGLAAGATVAAGAHLAQPTLDPTQLAGLASLTAAFALAPDLDVASVPQRWFYRGMALLLAALLLLGRPQAAGLLGLCALLPLVHHHRGWMHRWWAALLVPVGMLLLWRTLQAPLDWPLAPEALSAAILDLLQTHLAPLAAMVAGYATHLAVDGVGLRRTRAV